MFASRYTDEVQAAGAQRGEIFFYVPSSGHEATAVLASHMHAGDWLHCHYRDRALAYARGVSYDTEFRNLFGREGSNSDGRRMPGFPNDASLNILSTPTPVGNNVLQAVGVASVIKNHPDNPFVLCSLGDGATQQGDFYEGVAEAVRSHLPVLFLIQDNRFALSTLTKHRTFYSRPDGEANTFYGLPIRHVKGSDPVAADAVFRETVAALRKERGPQIVLFRVERLTSHTNADDHTLYRSEEELRHALEHADPVSNLRNALLRAGVNETDIAVIEQEIRTKIEAAYHAARTAKIPPVEFEAKRPLPKKLISPDSEYRGTADGRDLTMLEAMRETLRYRLKNDNNITLFGQDIEDPKGDVFGLTRGLSSEFPERVNNAPLAENTIVGVSAGQAMAGRKPVAFIQFADFIPVAFNHIQAELGSIYWRSNGQWECPVLLMSICGAYRPGLGPFHAQTMESIIAHCIGVDVFMPSTAADAAGLLNAAFESGRPSVFLYPKSLINDRTRTTSRDVEKQFVPIGRARITRAGKELTIVGWGGTMPVCERTADALEEIGIYVEIIDLRTLSPWDKETVIESARKTGRLLVLHEDNRTCGMAGEILATVAEAVGDQVKMARVTRPDTFIPYDFSSQIEVLPSYKRTLEKACEMLDIDLTWEKPVENEGGTLIVKAIGSSPSDETITLAELKVKKGDKLKEGDLIASVEADKASMDITAPIDGTITEVMLQEGDTVRVGTPMVKITGKEADQIKPVTEENPGTPIMHRRRTMISTAAPIVQTAKKPVFLSSITTVFGSRCVHNQELIEPGDAWDAEAIRKRTGIETRYWITGDENVLTLAVKAVRQLLAKENLDITEIGALICSTGTPPAMTPSLACRILKELSPEKGEVLMQAHDVNAACSGYLYALQAAYDFLRHDPTKKVIVVTAETLSPMINHKDPKTRVLFGDAATASLLCSNNRGGDVHSLINRPVLSAKGEEPKVLYVPNMGSNEFIEMEGLTVFKIAVRKMIDMLDRACTERGISVEELKMIVPHQANERIIEAIRRTIHCPKEKMFNHIAKYGNTSSNTLPIALAELMPTLKKGDLVGLTAFGGGFTFGAAVIEKE